MSAALWLGCGHTSYPIQWDSRDQILLSEESQVRVRASQSRTYDTTDRLAMLQAVIATFQDLGFHVEVLDETLGIVSGKKFIEHDGDQSRDISYLQYDTESLIGFTRSYRTWGPFNHRRDLIRLTVTIRKRNETQLIVRASAQFHLRPVENPEPYQDFYRTLEQARFRERATRASSRPSLAISDSLTAAQATKRACGGALCEP